MRLFTFHKQLWRSNLAVSLALLGVVAACSSANPNSSQKIASQDDSSSLPFLSDIVGVFSNNKDKQDDYKPVQYQPFSGNQPSMQPVAGNAGSLVADVPTPFNVGDRFVFDNPETAWTVIGKSGNAVFWQADNGDTQITDINPILPSLEWRSANRGSGRRTLTNLSGNLFPMQVGKVVSFRSSVTTDQPPYNWEFNWTCTVTGTQTLNTTTLGVVNTFVIVCDRQGQDQLTFYYSPQIGHYIRMESKGTNGYGEVARTLISYNKSNGRQNSPYMGQNSAMASMSPSMQNPLTATSGANNQLAQEMPGAGGQGIIGGQLQLGGMQNNQNYNQQNNYQNNYQNGGVMNNNYGSADTAGLPMPSNNIKDIFSPLATVRTDGGGNENYGQAQSLLPGLPVGDQPNYQNLNSGMSDDVNSSRNRRSLFDDNESVMSNNNANNTIAPPTGQQLRQQVAAANPALNKINNNEPAPAKFANAAPQAPAPFAPAAGGNGGGNGQILLHLASYKSVDGANAGWKDLSKQLGDILGGLQPVILEANIPNKGIYQRLYAGGVNNPADAKNICNAIKARGAYCQVMQ